MDFALDETQQAVAEAATGVLRRAVNGTGGEIFRAEPGYDAALWKDVINAGLLSLVLPEPLGGAGLGPVETAVVLTEVGRNVAAVPALATLALGSSRWCGWETPSSNRKFWPSSSRVRSSPAR